MRRILLAMVFILGVLTIGLKDMYFSWDDDPNLDQIPPGSIIPDNPPEPSRGVVDDDGYENFFLGTDFAEPHITMNPKDPKQSFTAYNTNSVHATINGYEWFTNTPGFGVSLSGDPVTAYDSLGNLYYENMRNVGGSIVGTQIIKSTNNSQSWLPSVPGNTGNDKNWIAADQTSGPYANYVYSTMTPGNVVRSTNQGASFSPVFSASNNLPGMMVAVGANGSVSGGAVYVVTNTGSSTSPSFNIYRSTNGGGAFNFMSSSQFVNFVGTFTGGRHSVEGMRTRPYPFITADNSFGPNRGRLYLVYPKNNPDQSGAKPDIICRYSTNGGSSWSSPVLVNDDANTTQNTQFMPAIWCDKETGRLYVKWMDTRDCPTSDSALIYATYSDDGGATFAPNQQISTQKMKINCSTCGGGGDPRYQGDYDAIVSNSQTSIMSWTDFRVGRFDSYVAYFPDYAMKVNTDKVNFSNGQTANIPVLFPSSKLYTNSVTVTATLDSTPSSGSINIAFQNGRDSITSFPDSVIITATAVGNVTPGLYPLRIVARGPNGTPAHMRKVDLLVNASCISVMTNRGTLLQYTVNGTPYTGPEQFVFANGTNVTISAQPFLTAGSTKYVFDNWSNGGDTTQTINVSQNLDLVCTYKAQYLLTMISSQPHTFGGNEFYDSAATFTFGVLSRRYITPTDTFYFRGWTGLGNGAYTSADSLGGDDSVQWSMNNPIVEICRWSQDPSPIGISQIGSEIPEKFDLFQNYPNPFNPTTKIRYDLAGNTEVSIKVYDLLGKEVKTLVNQKQNAGRYEVSFDGFDLSSGIYFYRIVTKEFVQVKRMLMVK